MPTLYQYLNKPGHYAKACIQGSLVTFQLREEAVEKLRNAGVGNTDKFPLSLLVDLVQEGDAYTGRSNTVGEDETSPGYYEAEQFEFEFDFPGEDEKKAQDSFPVCAVSGSVKDLFLVCEGEAPPKCRLLAADQRKALTGVTLSMPLNMLTPKSLEQLIATGRVPDDAPCLEPIRGWFAKKGSAQWDAFRVPHATQEQLNLDDSGVLSLK